MPSLWNKCAPYTINCNSMKRNGINWSISPSIRRNFFGMDHDPPDWSSRTRYIWRYCRTKSWICTLSVSKPIAFRTGPPLPRRRNLKEVDHNNHPGQICYRQVFPTILATRGHCTNEVYRESLKGGPQVVWNRVKKLRCVYLLHAGKQLFHLIFTQPGAHL